jgi:hypothetical protein
MFPTAWLMKTTYGNPVSLVGALLDIFALVLPQCSAAGHHSHLKGKQEHG